MPRFVSGVRVVKLAHRPVVLIIRDGWGINPAGRAGIEVEMVGAVPANALPAVDLSLKFVVPENLLMIVALPAVDASVKFVPSRKPELMIVCVVPDLFTIPAPSTVSVDPPVSIVKALAPGLKVIDSTVAFPVRNSEVTVEVLNVAVSPGLTGALGDVDQLVPKFQSPSSGLGTQTASTASTGVDIATNSNSATRGARIEVAIRPGSLLTDWVSIFIRCVFMGTVAIDG